MFLLIMLALVCGGLVVGVDKVGVCADWVDIGAGWVTEPIN